LFESLTLIQTGRMDRVPFLLFGREAWHTVNLLQEPVYLLTGMNFPLKALGQMTHYAVPAIGLLIPLTAGIDAMRQVLFRIDGFLPLWTEIGILAVLGVVFVGLAKFCLDLLERKAKAEGTLTVKWQ
ncbi:MAG: ABC transporter permease, partial [Gemmataceae bacterium]